ncbi:MAG: hypothetical protein DMF06_15510 [Verrucomicrobia bacterium]|nr:MAG: hypothetical protein DMF06_15510 [Verrucomicrobiota bacterium]
MSFRPHATKIVDLGIRIAIAGLVGVPLWLLLWFAACRGDGFPCEEVAVPGFAFLGPAFGVNWLWYAFGIPDSMPFDLFLWLLMLVSVPAFWGTVSYGVLSFYRRLRVRSG